MILLRWRELSVDVMLMTKDQTGFILASPSVGEVEEEGGEATSWTDLGSNPAFTPN